MGKLSLTDPDAFINGGTRSLGDRAIAKRSPRRPRPTEPSPFTLASNEAGRVRLLCICDRLADMEKNGEGPALGGAEGRSLFYGAERDALASTLCNIPHSRFTGRRNAPASFISRIRRIYVARAR